MVPRAIVLAGDALHRGVHQEGAVRAVDTLCVRGGDVRVLRHGQEQVDTADELRGHQGAHRVLGGEDGGDLLGDEPVRGGGEDSDEDLIVRGQGEAAEELVVREAPHGRANQARLRRDRAVPPQVDVLGDDALPGQIQPRRGKASAL